MVAQQMAAQCASQNCDFTLNTGDNFYDMGVNGCVAAITVYVTHHAGGARGRRRAADDSMRAGWPAVGVNFPPSRAE